MDPSAENAFFCRGCAPAPPQPPPAPPGWTSPGALTWGDSVLRGAYLRTEGALLRREEGGFTLAYPYSHARPFPLTPVFCLARVCWMAGRPWLLFSFDGEGTPRPPANLP